MTTMKRAVVLAMVLVSAGLFLPCPKAWGAVQEESVTPAVPEDVAAPPEDAEVTESGLASKVLRPGTGTEHPNIHSQVKVQYTGWTTDGNEFDSSYRRGRPSTFPLTRVIAGLGEGVQLMVVGEKRRFWIPEKLAYGGMPGRPAGMLVFDIELLEILPPPATAQQQVRQAPATPPDVAAPPDDAERLKSGLAWKVLREGQGTRHPKVASEVVVHYTGWTTDGRMFDSSVQRGEPSTFNLTQVIRGWSDALRMMVEGEKRRIWVPEKLAYKGRPGSPQGMLVFDVELLKIK